MLQAQRLSVAVHSFGVGESATSAWGVAAEMQLAGSGVEQAPSSDEEAPPRREPAPTLSGRVVCLCVFVCVCVCLCVFVCVLSNRCLVGRPICVCTVSAPLSLRNPSAPALKYMLSHVACWLGVGYVACEMERKACRCVVCSHW